MPDARIEKIEERVAWLEHHVTQQDKAMLEMSKRLDRLQAELLRQRERAGSDRITGFDGEAGGRGELDAATDRPPHY
ncbi:MAG: SlyX family protein [Burkholderiales bacterium]|nr:SlyX family protein [Opitutaceae bacterium]